MKKTQQICNWSVLGLMCVLAFGVFTCGCGGVTSAGNSSTQQQSAVISVLVNPASTTVQIGGAQQFAASVTGTTDTSVVWTATGGTISTDGLYTAPQTAGNYTVTATSVADNAKSASATVNVTTSFVPIGVSISPQSASVQINGTQQFTAAVTGSSNASVTWTASKGSITAAGLYTAPSTAGTYTVTATSVADTSKSASATVVVTSQAGVAVTLSPANASLAPGTTRSFTATVSNTSNAGVTWTTTGGSISGTGNTITYTAPVTLGSYTVTATSVADTTKSYSAAVTVTNFPTPRFEGYGSGATGGSNVVHVTNLNGSGSGSFAAAISSAGNHVVFDVAGTINGTFSIPSNTFVDGFSAPSPGITFTGGSMSSGVLVVQDVSNVIIQGVRVRGTSASNTKGIMLYAANATAHDIVVDHCEIENVSDEDIGSSGSGPGNELYNVTISWNLLGAPASSGGELVKYGAYHISIHHNLWVNLNGNDSRVPLVWAGDDSTDNFSWNGATIADVVGNVASNFLYGITYVTDGTLQDPSNIINNYLDGQDSSHARNGIDIIGSSLEKHYLAGNASVLNPSGTPSSYSCGASNICGTIPVSNSNTLSCGSLTGCQVSTPLNMPTITTSCVYDNAGRVSEWTNVINTAGVVTHFADDATSAALRKVPTTPTANLFNSSWNQQTGSCP